MAASWLCFRDGNKVIKWIDEAESGRFRVIGSRGCIILLVRCWRPVEIRYIQKIRIYFIGRR